MFEFPTAMVSWALCEWNKQINKVVYTGVLVSKGSLLKTLEETNNSFMEINEILPLKMALVNPFGRRKRYNS